MENFLLGLVSGGLGVPLWNFIRGNLLPYIYEHTSDNIKLTDKWRVMHTDDPSDDGCLEAEWEVDVEIKQKARTIFGKATARCTKGEPEGKIVEYNVKGYSLNSVVDITFTDLNNKSRNRTSFLLQMTGPGDEMEGHRLFLGRKKNDIRAVPCKWARRGAIVSCGTA